MSKFIPAIILVCFLLIIIPLSKFIIALFHVIKNLRKYFSEINLNSELHNLSPREFELWCGEFLKGKGYRNVVVSSLGPDGGVDIKCTYDDELIYVECKRYAFSSTAKLKVDSDIIRKLVGAMKGNDVKRGMIITTGIVTEDAFKFIETLPKQYNIEVVDGKVFNIDYQIDKFKFSLINYKLS